MESPKRGCDLGTCVVKRQQSKTHCDYFLRFRGFPRGQGLRSGPLRSKMRRFAFAFLSPLSSRGYNLCLFKRVILEGLENNFRHLKYTL